MDHQYNKKKRKMTTKKEINTSRSVHRIDLSLPVVQTDSYEIFYTIPSTQNSRIISRQKPLVDSNKKPMNQPAKIRSPARLKHLTGPIFVNLVVDMGPLTAESISTMNDTASNQFSNSVQSNRTAKTLPIFTKRNNKQKNIKDDSDRSRSSSGDRLLYESLGSFDDYNLNKIKTQNMWQNIHHPQLTSAKTLHMRRSSKHNLGLNDMQVKVSNTTSLYTLSQASAAFSNENLYEKIEHLTKNYFPSIQQIRHNRPCPELITNRMYLHREQKKNFMPILSRTRAVR